MPKMIAPNDEAASRRNFLKQSLAAAGVALTSGRQGAVSAARAGAGSDLNEITFSALREGLQSGKFTARSLTEKYLARIEEIDKRGTSLNSVIEINPEAMAIAEQLDSLRRKGSATKPLHGIPLLIKDNIDTADRMHTTAGSLALLGSRPTKDSFVAQKLREAGAIILGKTNLSEWANFRSSHATSGWSGRGGQTKNPYALDRNPCGSSSGSGAAVSANLCVAAVGTETDGSVVCPASANGIVGMKPTVGLISRSGIIPIAHSQDTAGPMARTVKDVAILMGVLAGADPLDVVTADADKHAADYTQSLDVNGLRGARLGIARKYFGFNDAVDELMNRRIAEMKNAGAIIVDPADLESHGKFDDTEMTVLLYELKADIGVYLSTRTGGPKSLKELIEFNERNKEEEMPYFGQDIFIKSEAKGPLTSKEYLDALEANHRLSRSEGIDAVMDKFHLDAIVAPTAGPAWVNDIINGDHAAGGSSNAAAVAGYPDITVPAGFIFGLPVGISFFGRKWSEPVLLKIAYAFEQLTQARKPPHFLPTAKL